MDFELKSSQEIKLMALAGQKLAALRQQLVAAAQPGTKLSTLEALAQKLIKQAGAKPSFSMVPNYRWATCINLNQGVVHGVPDDTIIKPGDLISIDVGLYYQNFHSDSCVSFISGSPKSPELLKFISIGRQALKQAIAQVYPGNHVGHISQAIQQTVESAGYSAIRTLTGHGIGRQLHQPPSIPCFLDKPINQTPKLELGLTIAIEVIYAMGSYQLVTDPKDSWTLRTQDGQPAAMFEHTVAVTEIGPRVLTQLSTSQTDKKLL
jgi:methionyl aminopeptidase